MMRDERELARIARKADRQQVMSTFEGRRFVWSVLLDSGLYDDTFVAGAADLTAYRQGRRAQGLELLRELKEACPRDVVKMVQEAANRAALEDVPDGADPSAHDHPG